MTINRRVITFLVLAVLLTGIWYLLSGMLDLLHFGVGVAVSVLIAASYEPVPDDTPVRRMQLVLYVPWLIWQIILSNLRVAYAVLHPKLPISPTFVAANPVVHGPHALTLLGCSITLTPGTVMVDIDEGDLFVHALDLASAQDILDGVMAERVSRVFPDPGAS